MPSGGGILPKKKERRRPVNERIAADPNVCSGEPCVKGTRVPVHVVLSHLAAGDGEDVILQNFPSLSREDVRACLEYAAYLASEKAVPL